MWSTFGRFAALHGPRDSRKIGPVVGFVCGRLGDLISCGMAPRVTAVIGFRGVPLLMSCSDEDVVELMIKVPKLEITPEEAKFLPRVVVGLKDS